METSFIFIKIVIYQDIGKYMDSITAYDLKSRVASYDKDMDIMHPRRHKMIDIALEVFPFKRDEVLFALDIGSGTGYFTGRFLEKYPKSRVIAVDGAQSMNDLARIRLGDTAEKIDFRTGDFRSLNEILKPAEKGDAVFSSYALHHLTYGEKTEVIKRIPEFLKPGGWFINADLIDPGNEPIEARIQYIRASGIVERAQGKDKRFETMESTRKFLDDLEETENDQPLTLKEDLEILRNAGFKNIGIFWLEYREVVYGGLVE